jgi:hypothetical protein
MRAIVDVSFLALLLVASIFNGFVSAQPIEVVSAVNLNISGTVPFAMVSRRGAMALWEDT